jgi:hypothetical protein
LEDRPLTIVRLEPSGPIELEPAPFVREKDLEDAVALWPDLLTTPGRPRLALVGTQASLPEAGILDLLLVDGTGVPIVAEAKLARNGQSRREVVGQIVDYVSALTALTVDELDSLVDGALESALRTLAGAGNDDAFESLWQAVGTNLRAGQARYIVVIDEPPRDLERIVRFLAARSNLDIELVAVHRYKDRDGAHVLTPQHLVRSSADATEPAPPKQMSADLRAVVDAYNARATAGLAAVGRAANYRQIRPPAWPSGMHYEFLEYQASIGVEIHLESRACQPIADTVQSFATASDMPFAMTWYPKWQRGPGRLVYLMRREKGADEVVKAMESLIHRTYDTITRSLPT